MATTNWSQSAGMTSDTDTDNVTDDLTPTDTSYTQRSGMVSDTVADNVEDFAEQAEVSKDAAAASLAGFVGRRLENNCSGLVLLGRGACALVPLEQLDCGRVVKTSSTASMLSSPGLKQQVWRDLLSLLRD